MLAYLRVKQVFQFPDKYILKRWTQSENIGVVIVVDEEIMEDDPKRFLMSRHSRLSYKASILIDGASLTDEGTQLLDEQFDYIRRKIEEINLTRTVSDESQPKRTVERTLNIIDPSEIRTKGSGKRFKSSKEKSKGRLRHGCGLRGVSHDKHNCPNLDNQIINNDDTDDEDFVSLDG